MYWLWTRRRAPEAWRSSTTTRLIVERAGDGSRSHAERLPEELLDALADASLSSAEIDLFAVASGPGSFTGLRIGIATIQGLAFVHQRRVAPVSALRALAEVGARSLDAGTRVAAWMDAHRRDVFSALYEVRAPAASGVARLEEIEGPSVDAPDATLTRWQRAGVVPQIICGDGAVIYAAQLPQGVAVVQPVPLAATIAVLAREAFEAGETVDPAGVQPLYVRRPDAEIARDAARLTR